MGDSTPRQQPLDAQATGETRDEPDDGQEQEPQAEPDSTPSGDPTKKQEPESKFHG